MSHTRVSAVSPPLDSIDCELLSVLAQEGRASYRELAERVRLSANAVADRVRRLQREGIIVGFRAEIDPAPLGRSLTAMVDIRLRPGVDMTDAEAALRRLPQLVSASHVTGRSDYVLHIACRDATELDELIRALNHEVGAIETETRLLLRSIKPEPPTAAVAAMASAQRARRPSVAG